MRKRISVLLSVFLVLVLAGCGEELRYGDTINAQTTLDASRTQNAIVMDVLRNSNKIMSLLTQEPSVFSLSQLEAALTEEMERTQEAMNRLEKFRQPRHLEDEFGQTFQALSNYKSALLFLREAVREGRSDIEAEKAQLINAISTLQSAHYVQP